MLFETKIKYNKVTDTGKEKMVTEIYLLNDETFGGAEIDINEQMRPYISGEFEITAIKRSNINEIVDSEGQVYYKAKVSLMTEDKKFKPTILVKGDNIDQAYKNLDDFLRDSISDYEIEGLTDSKIIEYFD